jgi:hypothetical protein
MMTDSYFICQSPFENSAKLIRTEPGYIISSTLYRPINAEKIIESLIIDFENENVSFIGDHVGLIIDPGYYIWVDQSWTRISKLDYIICKNNFKKCKELYNICIVKK